MRNIEYFGPKNCIRPSILAEYEKTGKYVFQRKFDGCWGEIAVDSDGSCSFFARSNNVFSRNELGVLLNLNLKEFKNSILIGEVEVKRQWSLKRTALRGYPIVDIHDIKMFNDYSFITTPWYERNNCLLKTARPNKYIHIVHSYLNLFEEEFQKIRDEGFEGAVLKKIDSTFKNHDREGKTLDWIKVKDFPGN